MPVGAHPTTVLEILLQCVPLVFQAVQFTYLLTINKVKEQAATTTESTHNIVATSSIGIGAAIAGQLPVISNIKQTVRRVRHKNQMPLLNLASLSIFLYLFIYLNSTIY